MMKFVVLLVQMAMIEIKRIYHSTIVSESVVVLLQQLHFNQLRCTFCAIIEIKKSSDGISNLVSQRHRRFNWLWEDIACMNINSANHASGLA